MNQSVFIITLRGFYYSSENEIARQLFTSFLVLYKLLKKPLIIFVISLLIKFYKFKLETYLAHFRPEVCNIDLKLTLNIKNLSNINSDRPFNNTKLKFFNDMEQSEYQE